MPLEELKKNPMMAHLIDSLENGDDIGHYGRLVFVTVGRHFLSEDELLAYLMKDPDCDEAKARGLIKQVEAHDYNPPKPDRIIDWMNQQDFPICEQADGDPNACNVYKSLRFPPEVYEKIASYYEGAR